MKAFTDVYIYNVGISSTELKRITTELFDDSTDEDKGIEKIKDWCSSTYDDDDWRYEFIEELAMEDDYDIMYDFFKFKYEKHRIIFLLKWNSQ